MVDLWHWLLDNQNSSSLSFRPLQFTCSVFTVILVSIFSSFSSPSYIHSEAFVIVTCNKTFHFHPVKKYPFVYMSILIVITTIIPHEHSLLWQAKELPLSLLRVTIFINALDVWLMRLSFLCEMVYKCKELIMVKC